MKNKPTVAEFFKKFEKKGHIFSKRGLRVKLRDGSEEIIVLIYPPYADRGSPIEAKGYRDMNWEIDGKWIDNYEDERDIIAVLDDAGNVIAGEAV